MVSRRKILSRSRDDLNAEQPFVAEEEDDVWYQKDKLFKVSIYFFRLHFQLMTSVRDVTLCNYGDIILCM